MKAQRPPWRPVHTDPALPDTRVMERVSAIYDASLDPARFAEVIADLCRDLGANSALLFTPQMHVNAGLYAMVGLSQTFLEHWDAYYFGQDVWTLAAARRGIVRGQFTTDEMLVPPSELLKTEYYNDFMKPHGVFRHLAHVLSVDDGSATPMVLLGFYRGIADKPFGEEEAALLHQVAPHLRRANDVYWRLRAAELHQAVDLAMLDRLHQGVALLSGTGQVLHLNEAAETALARNDGLTVEQGRLVTASADQTAQLAAAIAKACATSQGQGVHPGGFLTLKRPSGQRPWTLLVSPLPASPSLSFAHSHPAAVVFITDPESRPQLPGEVLAGLFRLTPAEARLALLLAQGESLTQIAEHLSVSKETLRSQLRSVFHKTGTHRQAELVRLLLGLSATVRL